MASASQLTLVDLVCALSALQVDTVLQLVKEVVKRPPQLRGDEVRAGQTPDMTRAALLTPRLVCLGGKQR